MNLERKELQKNAIHLLIYSINVEIYSFKGEDAKNWVQKRFQVNILWQVVYIFIPIVGTFFAMFFAVKAFLKLSALKIHNKIMENTWWLEIIHDLVVTQISTVFKVIWGKISKLIQLLSSNTCWIWSPFIDTVINQISIFSKCSFKVTQGEICKF